MTIAEEIDIAVAEVTAAEEALEAVLRDLRAGARAEKVTITAAMEQAFARLRKGRAELVALRARLSRDE